MVQQHTWYCMLCSNFHIYHRLLKKSKIKKIKKIKTFPYLPTHKLKNKSETDLFFSRPIYKVRTRCASQRHLSLSSIICSSLQIHIEFILDSKGLLNSELRGGGGMSDLQHRGSWPSSSCRPW